ncbi:TIGR02588 family protein [Rhizobium sp. 'Codium 1']|uniref:TIGR02588 family protein n=1 Tax=Rhizobium sp. 'Codium 1' TaxID=2940484 RepID=UPI001E337455|nr:TIGR02588 family protein [Rhizobium sp. 'Codium 1']MCC8934691.1 TIGR02588 family protein [Rhizobium sp. 'Codium 1']
MTRSSVSKNAEQISPHWIEWLTGLLATVIVLAMTGWIFWEAWTTDDNPPVLSAHVLDIKPLPAGWRVMIQVRNASDATAAAVEVKGTLMDGATPVEETSVTFDYVAAGSTSKGGLLFANDPSRYRLTILPAGFTEP